jgi:Glycosyltransferase
VTILHLVQKPQLRGAEIFTAQLASHTMRNGHKAMIVFVYGGEAQLPFTGHTFHLNSRKWKRFIDVRAWRRLADIIQKDQPDIIQANAGDTLKVAVLSKLLYRWKQPIIFRNASTVSLYIRSALSKKFNGFFFRHAAKIVSVCQHSAYDFASLYPQLNNRIVTIPVGIEYAEAVFNELPKAANEHPVLVHVGGFTFEKNHVRLISMFEKIVQKLPDARLQLIGDGPLRQEMELVVRKKGLQQHVAFFGFRNDALHFIAKADVLLLPSIIEGLPAVIPEAFFCGTPVVAYDVGGVGELVTDYETGRLIRKGDEEGFVNAVLWTLSDTDAVSRTTANARQLVTAEYLNYRLAWRFAELYRSLKEEPINHHHENYKSYEWKLQK